MMMRIDEINSAITKCKKQLKELQCTRTQYMLRHKGALASLREVEDLTKHQVESIFTRDGRLETAKGLCRAFGIGYYCDIRKGNYRHSLKTTAYNRRLESALKKLSFATHSLPQSGRGAEYYYHLGQDKITRYYF